MKTKKMILNQWFAGLAMMLGIVSTGSAQTLSLTAGNMPILTGASAVTFSGNVTLSGALIVRVGAFDYFLVGGGGGGGNAPGGDGAANGGAGGERVFGTLTLGTQTSFGVTIGAGGTINGNGNRPGNPGGDTFIAGVGTANGGAGGGPTGGTGPGAAGSTVGTITGDNSYLYGGGGGDGRTGTISTYAGGASGGGRGGSVRTVDKIDAVAGAANSGGGGGGGADLGTQHADPAAGGSGRAFIQYYGNSNATTGGAGAFENAVNAGTDTTRYWNTGGTFGLAAPAASQVAIFSGNLGGSGALTKDALGTLILTGNNSYTTTMITAGTLRIGNNTTTGSLGTGTVTNNSQLVFNRSNRYSVANVIRGTGALTQAGAGTLELTAANTYTGATTINSGALLVNGSLASASVVTVVGGTLGGTGSVGAVTVRNGGTLAPGNSTGIFHTGNLTLQSNAVFAVEINSDSSFDQLFVAGSLNLSHSVLSLSLGYTPANGTSFTIIQNDGTDPVLGTFGAILNGPQCIVSYTGGTGNDVVLTVIPEPSTWVLVTLALVPLFLRRRRS